MLPQCFGHTFEEELDHVLNQAGFDPFVKSVCAAAAAPMGQISLPLDVYLSFLFVDHFASIRSKRGISGWISDSLSLRPFVSVAPEQGSPDYSNVSHAQRRLPLRKQVFDWELTELERAQQWLRVFARHMHAESCEHHEGLRTPHVFALAAKMGSYLQTRPEMAAV